MTTPHTPPAALDVAAIGDLMGADEARSLLDAETSKRCRYCECADAAAAPGGR